MCFKILVKLLAKSQNSILRFSENVKKRVLRIAILKVFLYAYFRKSFQSDVSYKSKEQLVTFLYTTF